jgi:hypothetical protein
MGHHDHDAERLAKINDLLHKAKDTAKTAQTDPVLAQQLAATLDEMLKELRGPDLAALRRAGYKTRAARANAKKKRPRKKEATSC